MSHLNANALQRRYGRSRVGYPAFVNGDIIAPTGQVLAGASAIAAMSIEGVFAVSVHEEIIDHTVFIHKILPHMNAFHLSKEYIRRKYGIMHAYMPLASQLKEALWWCCSVVTACHAFDRVDIIIITEEEFIKVTCN